MGGVIQNQAYFVKKGAKVIVVHIMLDNLHCAFQFLAKGPASAGNAPRSSRDVSGSELRVSSVELVSREKASLFQVQRTDVDVNKTKAGRITWEQMRNTGCYLQAVDSTGTFTLHRFISLTPVAVNQGKNQTDWMMQMHNTANTDDAICIFPADNRVPMPVVDYASSCVAACERYMVCFTCLYDVLLAVMQITSCHFMVITNHTLSACYWPRC